MGQSRHHGLYTDPSQAFRRPVPPLRRSSRVPVPRVINTAYTHIPSLTDEDEDIEGYYEDPASAVEGSDDKEHTNIESDVEEHDDEMLGGTADDEGDEADDEDDNVDSDKDRESIARFQVRLMARIQYIKDNV